MTSPKQRHSKGTTVTDTVEEAKKREAVKKIFRNREKVDKMPIEQVTAIYLRLKAQGRL